MTDPTLTLTATVPPLDQEPMVVPCPECKDYGEGDIYCFSCCQWMHAPFCVECKEHWGHEAEIGRCPTCKHDTYPGTRPVRYEVVASGLVFTATKLSVLTGFIVHDGRTLTSATVKEKPYMSNAVECFGSYKICEQLAEQLLNAHRAGETLPGVSVTEKPCDT